MKENSLEKALDSCIDSIISLDIDNQDRVELLINLKHFLDKDKYNENIKVLRLEDERRKTL